MRKIFASIVILFIISIALFLIIRDPFGKSPQSGRETPAANTAIPSPVSSPVAQLYVTITDNSFSFEGQKFVPYGATFYPHWNHNGRIIRGSGWAMPEFTGYIDQTISLAQQAGLNTLRPTNYFDGISSTDMPNWWKNDTVWANMDYLLKKAHEDHMFVLLDLSSFRDRLLKTGKYPYNPSEWSDFLTFVGERYRNNPAILNYAFAGEVACPNGKENLRPENTAALTQFYSGVSEKLHLVDPNHLISTGGLSHLNQKDCGIDWQTIFSLPYINMSAIHVYSDNDRNITIPMVSGWSASHSRPFTVEEFGFKQEMGDGSRASAFSLTYSLLSPKRYNARSVIFWNLGPELAPSSYEVSTATPLTWGVVKQNDFTSGNSINK